MRASVATVDAEACYWAAFPAPKDALPRGKRERVLAYEFERFLPCPIEDVAYALDDSGETIFACALPNTQIHAYIETCDVLVPDRVPETIEHPGFDTGKLQMIGPRRPSHRLSKLRRIRHLSLALGSACVLGIVALALSHRASQLRAEMSRITASTDAVVSAVVGPATPGAQPAEVRLLAMLREARNDSLGATTEDSQPDALPLLSHIVSHWQDASYSLERLSIERDHARVTAFAVGDADAMEWADAIDEPEGWTRSPPAISHDGSGQRVLMEFHRDRASTRGGRTR